MKRLREDLHRYRLLLPCAIAAVLLLRWTTMRGRPERVMQIPLTPLTAWAGVNHGNAITYGVSANGRDLVAIARPANGGPERQLVRHPSARSEVGAFTSDGSLYLVNVWYRRESSVTGQGRLGGPMPFAGVMLPPRAQPIRGSGSNPAGNAVLGLLSGGSRGRMVNRSRTTLSRIPIAGGPLQHIDLDAGGSPPVFLNLGVVKNRIFWTRRVPLARAEADVYARKELPGPFPPARFELMVTEVTGGPAKRLFTGNYQLGRLLLSPEGAYFRLSSPGPSAATDLVYVAADSLNVTVRKNCSFDAMSAPVPYRGRVYWINDPNISGGYDIGGRRDLVSANPDGSGVRVVLNLAGGTRTAYRLGALFVNEDRLYGTLAEEVSGRTIGRNFRHFLCRIDPDSDQVIQKLTPLPRRLSERGVFDGGYFYFIVNEPSDRFFDWSDDDSRPDRYFLYRWKLPDD